MQERKKFSVCALPRKQNKQKGSHQLSKLIHHFFLKVFSVDKGNKISTLISYCFLARVERTLVVIRLLLT